ncbi:hypothetical protein CR513_04247, partial [Mucuna pruriens]
MDGSHPYQYEDPYSIKTLQLFEERLKAIEGVEYFDFNEADLCLISNIIIPPKFKLLAFDKYGGSTCLKNHLTMYCRRVAPHAHDEKLLIHFFQESLTKDALKWYKGLRRGHVQTWRSLAEAFLRQYKYNTDMTPDCSQL